MKITVICHCLILDLSLQRAEILNISHSMDVRMCTLVFYPFDTIFNFTLFITISRVDIEYIFLDKLRKLLSLNNLNEENTL